MKNNLNRRNLFKLGAATIVSVPLLKISNLFAAEEELAWDACPIVAPVTDSKGNKIKYPNKKAIARLKYVENATTSTHKKYKAGSACGNCKFYKSKIKEGKITDEEGGYAACSMLANGYVSRCGWCKSYKKHDDKYDIFKYLKKEEA